jgi:hypothetical protein
LSRVFLKKIKKFEKNLKKIKKRLAFGKNMCYNQEVIYGIVRCIPLSGWEFA